MQTVWKIVGLLPVLLMNGCPTSRSEPAAIKPEACLHVRTATLRLDTLDEIIASCTAVLNSDQSISKASHAETITQRGILYARRWGLTNSMDDAHRAIADISAGLDEDVIGAEKKRQLLIWRGQIYEAIGPISKARDDFIAALRIAPLDENARTALRRLAVPEN